MTASPCSMGSSTVPGGVGPVMRVVRHSFCIYNKAVFVWDEKKREANLTKHGFDFKDAGLVYDHPAKITFDSPQNAEHRSKDLAFIELLGTVLALVYVERGDHVRIISFRRASRSERNRYHQPN